VLIVDHVPKDPNAPSRYMIGSQRKTAAIDGASYRIEAVKVPSRTDDGLLKIIVAKDRHGTRAMGTPAAMVHVTQSLTGALSLTLAAPEATPHNPDGTFRPTVYMERVSRYLEAMPGSSGADIDKGVEGKATYIREALGQLLLDGFVERDHAGRGFAYRSVMAYREADDAVTHSGEGATVGVNDPVDNLARPTSSHLVPPRPGRGPIPPRPSSPPFRGDEVVGTEWGPADDAHLVPESVPVDNLPDPLAIFGDLESFIPAEEANQ
jgi:hypothetical protein